VLTCEREGRWRPAWYAEAQTPEGVQPLYIRGSRGGRWPVRPLAYEARVHRIFEERGIKVPHLFGYAADIPAMVMARVAGGPNLARAASNADRNRIREQLADQMRLMHALDPAPIAEAGARVPEDSRDVTLSAYREIEQIYLSGDRPPAPEIEFVRRWIDRNVYASDEPARVIAMDAGQFIFEGDELTAMIDFEFVCLGDRHTDFAALRTREKIEGFDDPESFYRLYEERGGAPVDIDRVRFQHIAFSLFTPLEIAHDRAHPRTAVDYHEYLIWHVISMKDALEGIAETIGATLDSYTLPVADESVHAPSFDALDAMAGAMEASDKIGAYRQEKVRLIGRYMRRVDAHGRQIADEYVADVVALTGAAVASEIEANRQLEHFVQQAPEAIDEAVLRVLHRQVMRQAAVLSDEGDWLQQSVNTSLRPLKIASVHP
jgi:aminoglycoside phosphotransferase (APT) family kinase protein